MDLILEIQNFAPLQLSRDRNKVTSSVNITMETHTPRSDADAYPRDLPTTQGAKLDERRSSDLSTVSSAGVGRDEGYQSTSTICSVELQGSRSHCLQYSNERRVSGSNVTIVEVADQEPQSDVSLNDHNVCDESDSPQGNTTPNQKRKQRFWKNMLNSSPSKTNREYKRSRSHSLPDILESISNIQIRGKPVFSSDRSASKDDIDQESSDISEDVSEAPLSSPLGTNAPICGSEHMEEPCYFCIKDNQIYCKLCVHIHNFHCAEKVKYIPEMAPEVRVNLNADTQNELLSMKYRFEKVKEENETKLDVLITDRRNYLHSVMSFKENVMHVLDCIEKDALEAMNTLFKEETKRHDENLIRLETVISDLDSYLYNVQSKDAENNVDIMFALQEASKAVMNYESILYDIHKYSYALRFTFEPSGAFNKFLNNANDLWELAKDERRSCTVPEPCSCDRSFHYRKAQYEKSASVKCSGFRSFDRERCNITGCEFLANGNLLLADNSNKKVKLMDTKCKLVSVLTLSSLPWDVCVIDSNTALVSLPDKKQLQFLGTSHKLSLKHVLNIDKNCWGVAKSGNDLVVTCWSFDTSQILIMDMLGNPKRWIQTANGAPFHTAWYVTSWNDVIHVSDWGTFGVTCLTTAGATVSDYKDRSLRGPVGISSDPEGNIYVCGRDSNNIHQLSSDGKQQQILLKETDGIHKPLCVSHCPKDDRLVVTSWMSETLLVFRLK